MLERLLGWLSALSVAWIVALTFADVLGRYLFASPVRGSVEMIEYAMAMVIFSALPLVTRQRGHVSVSLIDGWFKGLGQRIKVLICDVISALALGLLTWRLYLQGQGDLESGSATVVLELPQAPLSFAMAFLAGLTTLVVLAHISQAFRRQGDPA